MTVATALYRNQTKNLNSLWHVNWKSGITPSTPEADRPGLAAATIFIRPVRFSLETDKAVRCGWGK